MKESQNRAIAHYAGASLILSITGLIYLTHEVFAYEGNDIAQAAVLIGVLANVAIGVLGFMSGLALGRHISGQKEMDVEKEHAS